jgi:hypothetical protein
MAGAAGLFGCCMVTVLASHLFSATGSWAGWNQLLIVSNIMNRLILVQKKRSTTVK